jgi:hypothetical protein
VARRYAGGASGRYERYRETAFEYAFLLDLAGRAGALEGAAAAGPAVSTSGG